MPETTRSIEDALKDLHEIHCVLNRLPDPKSHQPTRRVLSARIILQAGAALAAALFLIADLFDGSVTRQLLLSVHDPLARAFGITSLGAMVVTLCAAVYVVLSKSSCGQRESTAEFVARHFNGLSFLSFSSDLMIKFTALSVAILAMRPDWVAPLLFLFSADYLFQGRLFTFSLRSSLALGVLCVAGGVAQWSLGNPSLVFSLTAFVGMALLSAVLSVRSHRIVTESLLVEEL